MKSSFLLVMMGLSGCGLFHSAPRPPPSPQLLIIGAAPSSVLFIDGTQAAPAAAARTQIIRVSPGAHVVEVRVGDTVSYREQTFLTPGESRTITVLSGNPY